MVIPSQYKERHCCGISRRTEDTMKYIRSVLAYQIGGLGGGGGGGGGEKERALINIVFTLWHV